MNAAAVSYLRRQDGRLLCVWNRRYAGWTLPGGKVEEGETVAQAQRRELFEETGVTSFGAIEVYAGETSVRCDEQDRGRMVHLFRITAWEGWEHEREPSCPVTWLTEEEFLAWSPFSDFYKRAFARMEATQ